MSHSRAFSKAGSTRLLMIPRLVVRVEARQVASRIAAGLSLDDVLQLLLRLPLLHPGFEAEDHGAMLATLHAVFADRRVSRVLLGAALYENRTYD